MMFQDFESSWNVESLEDFLYYFCPDCDERKQNRFDFLQHALNQHPVSNDYLIKFCLKEELNHDDNYHNTDDIKDNLKIDIDNKQSGLSLTRNNYEDYEQVVAIVKEENNINEDDYDDILMKDNEEEDFVVEEIIDKCIDPDGKIQYLIKWKDYDVAENTWEMIENLNCNNEMIEQFEESLKEDSKKQVDNTKDVKLGIEEILLYKKCDQCEEKFKTQFGVDYHVKIIHDKAVSKLKPFKCNNYQKSFSSKPCKKKSHERIKGHECDICGKSFSENYKLKAHKANVHEKRKFKCDFNNCDSSFDTFEELREHKVNDHAGDKMNYNCQYCEKSYNNKRQFKDHIRNVHEENVPKVSCDTCGKSFKCKKSLKKHVQRIHEGTKNYICEEKNCGKAFVTKPELRKHIEYVHEGIRDHQCDLCGQSFYTNSSLKSHTNTVHDGSKRYSCNFEHCKESFDKLGQLKKHKENDHTGDEAKYPCKECDKGYNDERTLNAHIDRVHKGITFVCFVCGKQFAEKKSLKIHMKNHEKEESSPEDTTIQFHPDSEWKDVSNDPLKKSKVWDYFLWNITTQNTKCRFCGHMWHQVKSTGKIAYKYLYYFM